MKEMRTWLIQRLNKPMVFPEGHPLRGKDNPFAFGGGFRNGGLSKEAMDLLRPIFSFDYMGAAEFEFGEVPRAIAGIVERIKDFEAVTVSFDASAVKFEKWEMDRYLKPVGPFPFYIFAHKDHVSYAKDIIAMDLRRDKKFMLKEHTFLPQCLFTPKDKDRNYTYKVGGWLELDNGFFFFIDKEMFEKTVALFTQKEETKS